MLDDKLICPKCQTKFYFNEVRNIVHHRKEEMPIRCPKCNYIVKEKLSHGYFVSYIDKEANQSKKEEVCPSKYQNIKTGAIISAADYQRMVEEQEWLLNDPINTNWLGVTTTFLENEETNRVDSYENYIPYHEK
ncbi:MAG: hypothetical protein IC227_08990 [Enterococcus lacertideformus]|uniref:Uncharacterized protein n=1 Tax=Enterococcus lacertideformus TaxID=2771493 RepID=A0A931AZ13_9ENTE|nr:hypothetical protein [Enterococcus lacertideformus]